MGRKIMSHDFKADLGPELQMLVEVPHHLDILPDGREVLVIGDPEGFKKFNHRQGDNPYGYEGTCGLVSCQDILLQFGVKVTEADIVSYAIKQKLCNTSGDMSLRGATTQQDQVKILKDFGVPAHYEQFQSLEDLAAAIEQDSGVIISLNAGVLRNDRRYYEYGQANHAVVVTGVARDPNNGDIIGAYINDSGDGKSGKFVDADTMNYAWEETGGGCVMTDITHGTTPKRR
jgi:Peptidase_C39 like family